MSIEADSPTPSGVDSPMFAHLRRFLKILVTGPQRAGTTIAARMIAADTGHRYVDEDEIFRDRQDLAVRLLASDEALVIHCPALCRYVHELADSQTAVVLLRRAIPDIVASQQRIGWKAEPIELRRYGLSSGVISEVKYDFWESYQKPRIEHSIELAYESLRAHPLWIDKSERRGFGPRQTTRNRTQ